MVSQNKYLKLSILDIIMDINYKLIEKTFLYLLEKFKIFKFSDCAFSQLNHSPVVPEVRY